MTKKQNLLILVPSYLMAATFAWIIGALTATDIMGPIGIPFFLALALLFIAIRLIVKSYPKSLGYILILSIVIFLVGNGWVIIKTVSFTPPDTHLSIGDWALLYLFQLLLPLVPYSWF